MKARVKHSEPATRTSAATNSRSFRTFLLVSQFEAREIGARIALARNERSMTQEELAGAASFSKRSLQDYEAGITIPYKHLKELSVLLGHKPEWFLRGEKEEVDVDRLSVLEAQLVEALERLQRVEALLRADDGEVPPQSQRETG